MDNQAKCIAQRTDGQPCSQKARPGRPYCWAHDPELQAARLEGARKGGKNKATAVRLAKLVPADLKSVFEKLQDALRATEAGDMDPRIANAMANVARAMVAVVDAGQVAERLAEVEAMLQDVTGRPGA